jgi:hypothetical protein
MAEPNARPDGMAMGINGVVHAYVGQNVTHRTPAPAPPLVFLVPTATYDELEEMRQSATTHKNRQKHRDHGGRAALLSSDVELMVRHDRTCGRPVHGVGRGRG